ncbi:LD-carboxypeptidase [Ectobacillus funiculus]
MRKPSALQYGDTVMIIAPASPADRGFINRMVMKLEKLGLSVRVGKSVQKKRGYLAGTDSMRLQDVYEAFCDPRVKAVFAARGGYGSARFLPALDFSVIRQNPKIFWGYSDITALHTAFIQYAQLVTFHGPMMEEGGRDEEESVFPSLHQLFSPTTIQFQAAETNTYPSFSYSFTAPIIGGNVTVLTSTMGTPYEIDTTGKILLLEDVGEEPYRLDRMFNQLRLAGKFERCAGVIAADFHNCNPSARASSLTIAEIIHDHIVPYNIPILSGFPIGHCKPNEGIPLGVQVTMDGIGRTISFESGVQ